MWPRAGCPALRHQRWHSDLALPALQGLCLVLSQSVGRQSREHRHILMRRELLNIRSELGFLPALQLLSHLQGLGKTPWEKLGYN